MNIFNLGSCNIDYVYSVNHIVAPGETQTTQTLNIYPGGKGLNQSIAVSRAGSEVLHAGCIGEDGDMLIKTLSDDNVDTSCIKRTSTKNGHAIIQVAEDGENSIFLFPGSNHEIDDELVDSVAKRLSTDDIILLQNEVNNLEYIIDRAFASGARIALNPSPFTDNLKALDYSKLSYLILNKLEIEMLTDIADELSALQYMINKYPSLKIVLTLGGRGCIYCDSQGVITHKSYNVKVVDTTAAGDTFTGYFISAIAKEMPVGNALAFASAAAALSIQKNGASPSIPYINEVTEFLKNN